MGQQTDAKKGMPKWLKVVGNVIIWIFLIFAALMTVFVFSSQSNSNGVGSVFGKIPVNVVSNSMSPVFKSGDLLIDNQLTSEQKAGLAVGDVVTFYADINQDGKDELNTHRIISIEKQADYTFYKTKGDNNQIADTYQIRNDQIVGKWADKSNNGTKISGLGSVIGFLQQPTGFLVCIVLPLVIFFLYEIYRFIAVIISMKSKKISAVDEEEIKRKAVEEYLQNQNKEPNQDSDNDK